MDIRVEKIQGTRMMLEHHEMFSSKNTIKESSKSNFDNKLKRAVREINEQNHTQRYYVYCWDTDSQKSIKSDYDINMDKAIYKGIAREYGELLGEFDDKQDILEKTQSYIDDYNKIAIYDSYEKNWINIDDFQ